MQTANTAHLLLGIGDFPGVDALFSFKRSVNALCWNNGLSLIFEYERRVLTVEDNNIDLFAEIALAVHNVRG